MLANHVREKDKKWVDAVRSESVDVYSFRVRFVRTYKKFISIPPNPPKCARIKDTHVCVRARAHSHTRDCAYVYTYIYTRTHAEKINKIRECELPDLVAPKEAIYFEITRIKSLDSSDIDSSFHFSLMCVIMY